MAKTAADVVKMAKEVQMVDFRFTDLPGQWQHFSIPAHQLDEEFFEDGIGFDGSSIRGFQEIHESDMLLIPDAAPPLSTRCWKSRRWSLSATCTTR